MNNALNFDEKIYLDYLNLLFNPFPIVPDDNHFFFTSEVEKLVAELVHGINSRKGFMLLTGEVGLGKTTICRRIISSLNHDYTKTAFVLNTSCQGKDLLKEILEDFEIITNKNSIRDLLKALSLFLIKENSKGNNCAIIIDDAQNLSQESLEMIRMISNLETDSQKLVQILLSGQPELDKKLENYNLRQLKSRIIIYGRTKPLTNSEVEHYIQFKLNLASKNHSRQGGVTGNGPKHISNSIILTKQAYKAIYILTKGNIRKINILMDRVLYAAFLYNTKRIEKPLIVEANKDLYKKPFKTNKKMLFLAASIIFISIGFFAVQKPEKTKADIPPVKSIPKQIAAKSELKPLIPVSIGLFLKYYNLESFKSEFNKSLNSGDYADIKRKIFNQSGLLLIELKEGNKIKISDFGQLSYKFKNKPYKSVLIFWKPEITINKFYYYYTGDEIKKLQKYLSDINFYRADFDGVVGKKIMLAVSSFQKLNEIEVTGFPDDRTLFLICQKRRNLQND